MIDEATIKVSIEDRQKLGKHPKKRVHELLVKEAKHQEELTEKNQTIAKLRKALETQPTSSNDVPNAQKLPSVNCPLYYQENGKEWCGRYSPKKTELVHGKKTCKHCDYRIKNLSKQPAKKHSVTASRMIERRSKETTERVVETGSAGTLYAQYQRDVNANPQARMNQFSNSMELDNSIPDVVAYLKTFPECPYDINFRMVNKDLEGKHFPTLIYCAKGIKGTPTPRKTEYQEKTPEQCRQCVEIHRRQKELNARLSATRQTRDYSGPRVVFPHGEIPESAYQ